MNISEEFGLTIASHQEIDFIDINLDTDTELYIDPTLIDGLPASWCIETKKVLSDFFDGVFECCKTKDYSRLDELVAFGKEPNETKLGLSIEQSCGKGSKPESLYRIFRSIADQCLIEKGIVEKPSELCVFVSNFAEDRMSDLVTNIIRRQLYKFTIQQCEKFGVRLSPEKCDLGKYWDISLKKWQSFVGNPLIVDGRTILLVPKIIVRRKLIISVDQYIQKHVLTYRQSYHLEKRTGLSHRRYDRRRGYYYVPPTKKEVYEKEVKGRDHKDFARNFAEQNPHIADGFRNRQVKEKDIWDYVLSDNELDYYVYGKKVRSA
ncbi:MAG: hypothetical protein P4L59_10105 [Desulfosporosinus sp.]|nr:hypothetical protein [Desulfosporosinus sp.]